ncbi:Trihelix transcription factor [Nymphaea thermarum]|nr:Trihelix transcription factor [Nymphaea thermarum]
METPFEFYPAGVPPIPSTVSHQPRPGMADAPQENTSPLAQHPSTEVLPAGGRKSLSPVCGEELTKGGTARNRWPQAETAALLRIRLEMDSEFRDSNLKGPLWEEVSRKLAEFGYQRDAKKCKEKFENIYKYYRRTKEGRVGRRDGRSYRFFNELEALEANNINDHINQDFMNNNGSENARPRAISTQDADYGYHPTIDWDALPFENLDLLTCCNLSDSSDGGSDDPEYMIDYKSSTSLLILFENFFKQVVAKQDAMHHRFLEMLEKRENDLLAREAAWREEERARVDRESQAIAQERSLADLRYDAIISTLEKICSRDIKLSHLDPPMIHQFVNANSDMEESHESKGLTSGSGGRWPRSEVHALIELRKGKGLKFQETGTKSGLWDDIAAGMARLGYKRSAKRCKEKWENINKYFRKTKGSNRKRPRNSKTCPYFDELEVFYQKGMPNSFAKPLTGTDMISDD